MPTTSGPSAPSTSSGEPEDAAFEEVGGDVVVGVDPQRVALGRQAGEGTAVLVLELLADVGEVGAGEFARRLAARSVRERGGRREGPVASVQGLVDALPHPFGRALAAGVPQLHADGRAGYHVPEGKLCRKCKDGLEQTNCQEQIRDVI